MRRIGKKLFGYCPRGGYVNRDDLPFRAELPLALRNQVSGKSDKSSNVACIQEMSVLFACLKKHEFNESQCGKEISTFQKCYSDHSAQLKAKEEQEKKGLLVPGARTLTHKQATELLKKFPTK